PTIGYAGFIAISRQSIKTEAELNEVLKFLDKMSSKDGQILENNGIAGVNFTPDGSYSVAIKGGDADVVTNDTQSFAQLGTNTNGFQGYTAKPATPAEQAFYENRLKFQASDLKSAVQNPANALVSETYTAKGAQLDQLISDARLKYIAGQLNTDQYQSEIKRWHTEGGDQIITEMNDLYAKFK
ncbi:MAG TPA: ABC transporter substrate-binding protein, partial [Propionibacteriaceae bacterium]|nr:ABC transporter substrate-binding protein [Propionibacteriaceae bacterium]